MIDFTIETDIGRPPADVFAYVADPDKLATWQTNVTSTEADGPVGLGTRIREVRRGPGGKRMEQLVEIVAFEPGRTFGMHVVEGPPVDGELTFTETPDGGTRVAFRVYGQAPKLVTPLLRRTFKQACGRLKTQLEAPGVPRP